VSVTDALRYRPGREPDDIDPEPHVHHWQAVGIVAGSTDPVRERVTGLVTNYVAQSCECGAVRAVPLTVASDVVQESR